MVLHCLFNFVSRAAQPAPRERADASLRSSSSATSSSAIWAPLEAQAYPGDALGEVVDRPHGEREGRFRDGVVRITAGEFEAALAVAAERAE